MRCNREGSVVSIVTALAQKNGIFLVLLPRLFGLCLQQKTPYYVLKH